MTKMNLKETNCRRETSKSIIIHAIKQHFSIYLNTFLLNVYSIVRMYKYFQRDRDVRCSVLPSCQLGYVFVATPYLEYSIPEKGTGQIQR